MLPFHGADGLDVPKRVSSNVRHIIPQAREIITTGATPLWDPLYRRFIDGDAQDMGEKRSLSLGWMDDEFVGRLKLFLPTFRFSRLSSRFFHPLSLIFHIQLRSFNSHSFIQSFRSDRRHSFPPSALLDVTGGTGDIRRSPAQFRSRQRSASALQGTPNQLFESRHTRSRKRKEEEKEVDDSDGKKRHTLVLIYLGIWLGSVNILLGFLVPAKPR
ncbi:hypothetical protein LZ32DRAFT_30731 [Colletotrichum eremochloae]|nr:hypothetical protein LZ32DRAFT_30731 [Colletotrichum eremochloae]